MKTFFFCFAALCLWGSRASAQRIENVNFYPEGNRDVYIEYDLLDAGPEQYFYVSVEFTENQGRNWNPISQVSGAVGPNQTGGTGKRIVWRLTEEYPEGVYSIYAAFRITAEARSSGNSGGGSSGGGGIAPPGLNIEMVDVRGGTFTMGCTPEQGSDCRDNEKPPRSVSLSDFSIGKYEVTQAQWKAVMGSNPSRFQGCDDCPVEKVSWNDVQEFIQKLNAQTGKTYRLPTEAEWEYAARGGSQSQGYQYAGGNNLDEVAWHGGNSGSKTHKVGSKAPNELGIYDMSGNVWEWCSDWYGDYTPEAQTNPTGPNSGSFRVLRGGSWYFNYALYFRSAYRDFFNPNLASSIIGFRLVVLRPSVHR